MTPSPPDVLLPPSAPVPASPPVLPSLFSRLQPSAEALVLILAVLIGGGAGMGVVTFHYLIEIIHHWAVEDLMGAIAPWGTWTLACVPTAGGLVVGLMRWRWRDFGPGISSLITATQTGNAPLPLRQLLKMAAAAVSLGTGASLGPEGPSVEIGANFGLLLGQVLQVSQERQRLLLGAGAAAGLAAGFNAPIAGVFFALEVVLGTTFATSAVSVVLLAAVVAALIAQIGLGSQPAFTLPAYEVRSLLELPLYVGLGLFASLVSLTYTGAIRLAQQCFKGEVPGFRWLSQIPYPLHPILGGACVGLAALQLPQILGIGYETVEAVLRDVKFSLALLVGLLVVKLVMTALSLGSGLVGGVFAPAMFLGASLGAAYGKVVALLLPAGLISIAAPPAYAMVGMAAVLAGSARAPLTAILLLFELTRDYRIVLPLMAAVGLSVWLVERLTASPSPKAKLEQMGLNVETDPQAEILKQVTVQDAMQRGPLVTLLESLPILDAGQRLVQSQARSALVVDPEDRPLGIITLQDINRHLHQIEPEAAHHPAARQRLGDICTTHLVYAYPTESLAIAVDRMTTRGLHQLPVIHPDAPEQILGWLEREAITLTCTLAIARQNLDKYSEQHSLAANRPQGSVSETLLAGK